MFPRSGFEPATAAIFVHLKMKSVLISETPRETLLKQFPMPE